MSDEPKPSSSPRWSSTAKLVVGLTIAGLGAALIFRFQNILAPLLFSFILAYLFHPIASFFNRRLKIPWRLISTIIFILLFATVIALLTWGGISIFDQVQNLINYLQGVVGDFPTFIADMTAEPLKIGPWEIDLSSYQASDLTTQFQGLINSALSQIGTILGSIASGVGSTITWTVFILIIAYFIMSESNGVRASMIKLTLPKYQEDITRLGNQLSHIWNAFLRGQFTPMEQLAANEGAVLLRKPVHEFSCLGVGYFPGGRPVAFATAPASIRSGCLREDSEVLEEGLISRLAVAVSILVQHTELTQAGDKDPGAELLEAVRDSCLAVIETVWLKDLNNAYDASRRRRETLFKRCGCGADLRERIHQEDAHLREDMARLSTRLEEMLAATDGRYAKASVNLTAALRRMLG